MGFEPTSTGLVETKDGARIAWRTFGDSPDTVVLIPSLGRSGADFDAFASDVAASGYTAVAVDPRGTGETTGPLQGLTLHDLAADVAAVIAGLDHAPCHVVGHAFGNRVARCLAADHPSLVRTVILLAAGGLVEPESEIRRAGQRCFQLDLPDSERLAAVAKAFFSPRSRPALWRDGWWPIAAAAQGAANAATQLEDWWTAGSAPLLVIQGLDDVLVPPANGRALSAELGERVELVELADAGHALLPEQPAAISRYVLAFLDRH